MLLRIKYAMAIGVLLASQGVFAGCELFEHANYQGDSLFAMENEEIEYVGDEWNDQFSSIQVTEECTFEGYEHANFQGAHVNYDQDVEFFGESWNDRISSFVCACVE